MELPAIIHAPLGRDAENIAAELAVAEIATRICDDGTSLWRALSNAAVQPFQSIIISQEGAGPETAEALIALKSEEPSWANVPVLFLVTDPESPPPACRALDRADPAVHYIMLKRPVRADLLRAVAVNYRQTRARQFETRDLLQRLTEAEERQRFLLSELRHRTRNAMAVLQGVFRLTARRAQSVEELSEAFSRRLSSMAQAHDTLSGDQPGGVLGDIIREQVEPYTINNAQLELEGEEIRLPGKLSFDLAVVLHELATNAAKYGALSVAQGFIRVHWTIDAGVVAITWRECDGPPVETPSRKGLGSQLIEGMNFPSGSHAESTFEPDGLVWHATIRLPETEAR